MGIPEIHPNDILMAISNFEIIDVRRPEEFNGELGHIEGAKLVTLGPDLFSFLRSAERTKKFVFVCRSGNRSGQATLLSQELGISDSANMLGGMLLWNELNLPVSRD